MSNDLAFDSSQIDTLHTELRGLIAASRQRLAGAVNVELTRLYWTIGQRLNIEVLGGERAQYGTQLIDRLGQQLTQEFGRGFEAKNLRRMLQFAQAFKEPQIVATLSRQLSWSHVVALLPLKSAEARLHYAEQAALERWSVRELRAQIERKAFERRLIASAQATAIHAAQAAAHSLDPANVDVGQVPALIFKDPYFLDFLGLNQGHDEADLEAAILRQLRSVHLGIGTWFRVRRAAKTHDHRRR